jgi:phosphatidylglycerol:prolipoprotein diacylglycerol transferase
MRPVLVSLGPWSLAALPLLFLVVYTLVLLWQWGEHRWAGAPPPSARRALLGLLPAALITAVLFFLIHRFGPIHIKSWGTMLVLAFAAGTGFMARYGDRRVITPAECLDFALYCLVGAVLGARLLFVALDWGLYAEHPSRLLNVWEGGLSFHGGLLGAVLAAGVFCLVRRKSFPAILDQSAPGVALGYAFARLGCFLNGCCHGHPCDLPWAMRFPHGTLPDVPVHPTQLYALLASLAIFVILIKLRGKFPRPGHLFLFYLAIYSVARFLLEFTRAGTTGRLLKSIPWMTVGQLASIGICVAAVLAIALTWRRPRMPEAATEVGAPPVSPTDRPPA